MQATYYYEAHYHGNSEIFMLKGAVAQTYSVYAERKPSVEALKLMSTIPTFTKTVTKADGWDDDIEEAELNSYIVLLENVNIRPM